MSCIWTKRLGTALLLLALAHGSARAVVALPGEGDTAGDEPRMLEISTSGYSRFEISGSDVVAFYTGGVTAQYAGYTLTCESLWLNQAAQRARLSGDVSFVGSDARLSCPELEVDIAAGTALLAGGVNGALLLEDSELTLACGSIELELPDTDADISPENLRVSLLGTALLETSAGHRLSAELISFDGSSGVLLSPDGFVAELHLPRGDEAHVPAPVPQRSRVARQETRLELPQIQRCYLSGSVLTARLSSTGELESASILEPLLTADGMRLSAESADVAVLAATDGEPSGYVFTLSGSPVHGSVQLGGQQLALAAQELRISSSGQAPQALAVSGAVRVQGMGLSGSAEEMLLSPVAAGGYALSFPRGLRVGGDLAAISGTSLPGIKELLRVR